MNKEEFTPEEKDALRRLERMTYSDIQEMSLGNLPRLACNFHNKLLVRMIVAKGKDKKGMMKILRRIREARNLQLSDSLVFDRQFFYQNIGYGDFSDIQYDIESNLPILPQEEEEEAAPQTSDSPDDTKAELEMLREQVEQFRNKKKGTAPGLNQAQTALFGLALANAFGFNYSNRKKELAPMLHGLFGWGEAKLATCMSEPCSKKERDELANLFKDLCPRLYATIMNRGELPREVTPQVTP